MVKGFSAQQHGSLFQHLKDQITQKKVYVQEEQKETIFSKRLKELAAEYSYLAEAYERNQHGIAILPPDDIAKSALSDDKYKQYQILHDETSNNSALLQKIEQKKIERISPEDSVLKKLLG